MEQHLIQSEQKSDTYLRLSQLLLLFSITTLRSS